jgi:hypothetical protein
MNRQDFDILFELSDIVAKREQRSGVRSRRDVTSSSVNRRRIAEFARKCERGELKGRERKRKAHQLFLEVMRSVGGVD